jgi:capsular exopolysaccharide synthesis family protein
MSKMYKALQKAEKERKATVKSIAAQKRTIPSRKSVPRRRDDRKPSARKPDVSSMYLTGPHAVAVEEFRKLRTIIFQASITKPMQAILVTSAVPSEGKTTVASNLALAISHGVREHAVFIDCDLRNSHSTPLIKESGPLGLSDYLMGKLDPTKLIVKTGNSKLSVLPSGSMTSNPAELVGSEKMRNLVRALKSHYAHGYLIIDSPPIMLTTEPIILSEMVDGIILVVRAAKTPHKILGIVFNQSEVKHSYHSSSYYSYYAPKKMEG